MLMYTLSWEKALAPYIAAKAVSYDSVCAPRTNLQESA